MIDWSATKAEDRAVIQQIVDLAKSLDPSMDVLTTTMDLEACHLVCPLDLDRMEGARPGDLLHDIKGIHRHLDRDSGQLRDHFVPRFAKTQ